MYAPIVAFTIIRVCITEIKNREVIHRLCKLNHTGGMKMTTGYDEILDSKDIQHILRISKNTANELLRSGKIPCVRAGNRYRVSRRALEKWLEAGLGAQAEELASD